MKGLKDQPVWIFKKKLFLARLHRKYVYQNFLQQVSKSISLLRLATKTLF